MHSGDCRNKPIICKLVSTSESVNIVEDDRFVYPLTYDSIMAISPIIDKLIADAQIFTTYYSDHFYNLHQGKSYKIPFPHKFNIDRDKMGYDLVKSKERKPYIYTLNKSLTVLDNGTIALEFSCSGINYTMKFTNEGKFVSLIPQAGSPQKMGWQVGKKGYIYSKPYLYKIVIRKMIN
jgi:hypothetical protein